MMAKTNYKTIDEYIATFPKETQKILEEIRTAVKGAAPDAKEKISYQIPTFELNGKNLIYFAGWKKHVSIYPVPPGDAAFEKEIAGYMDGKGTLKFSLSQPIPLMLIGKVTKYHVKRITGE